MSENSSDSDSSCGWTVINHEGSDIETAVSENGGTTGNHEFASEEYITLQEEEEQPLDSSIEGNKDGGSSMVETPLSALEETKAGPEAKKESVPDDGSCIGANSDDSDIVTLETPKAEEVPTQEEAVVDDEEAQSSEDFNMGSSSSSQYTFCQPETANWLEKLRKIPECLRGWGDELKKLVSGSLPFQVFPSQPADDESSSDETSNQSSPALRRRRAKKRLASSSESEVGLSNEQENVPPKEERQKRQFSSGLNRCIILALVIAVSMGFGHFYGKPEGTIQIQKRQQLVEKTHEDELNGMKDDLYQCQQQQEVKGDHKVGSLKEDLATCLISTEVEKKSFEFQKRSLATENQHLRESLENEEKALASLQEELRKLRQQIRNLEDKGTSTDSIVMENQKLKEHLEEEKQKNNNFLRQKEILFAEAQMLRRELDKERQITEALKEELEQLSSRQTPSDMDTDSMLRETQEIEILQGRLAELEKKLNFEQQRSDLWEKLYVEMKDQNVKQEVDEKGQKQSGKGTSKTKKKPKETFFGSVKETFDAMKNSTKEFVRHHKEKIKQAKEAVKENLKKFSDSVKSTFRHFKDTTKNIFDEKEKKPGDKRYEANKKARTVYREYKPHECYKHTHHRGPSMQNDFKEGRKQRPTEFTTFEKDTNSQKCLNDPLCNRKPRSVLKGCSGIFECAHQEFISLFNKVLDPIRVDEFNRLIQKYLQQEVDNFHHWRELENFINKFFHNGVFIHDQMLFTDFVNDIKDYLEEMKEYQNDDEEVFEDLDKYIYRYYFHYDNSPQFGPSQPSKRPSFIQSENSRHEKQAQKYHQRNKREGKWHKHGRTNGRHMANLEIELGQLPFDPKY
ncbi:cell cycle progression protein 1 isoform X3 [Alligator sinensis]|nr:cell cycle progression protein 1 isoform X3 [Alligator sinensis]XP_025052822.1 cell cycle progression protein 1 isoform X3 [Alligator sinensis]XP_025052823.1 cell cycle progression protein 1 isoform X3 [Alligator sinensis]XP_025052824.1 cell cycle progression protein 1 isoform X3 [Alligator sinensis]XP_025052826.1 cell cycle progression protein 1 isoform X3 [Alligator sinensis]XP_025052827.1 cell cycle progression protein 1 isoform X3 [Alligator sinensis]XP_025052828.1 cell cycle progressi